MEANRELAKFFGFQVVLGLAVALYILGSTVAGTDRTRLVAAAVKKGLHYIMRS